MPPRVPIPFGTERYPKKKKSVKGNHTIPVKMATEVFQGVNCQNGVPESQNPGQVRHNVNQFLDTLGADKQCIKEFDTKVSTSASSGGFRGDANILGGLAGSMSLSGNFQSSSTAIDDSMTEKGCGSLLVNSKRVFDSVRSINCTLHQASSESSVAANASASIEVRIQPPPGQYESLLKAKERTEEKLYKLAFANNTANPEIVKKLSADLSKSLAATNKSIADDGKLFLEGSTLSVDAGVRVKTLTQNISELTQDLETDVKNVIQATAEQKLQQRGGKNAASPDIKSLVTQEIDRRREDITATITQDLSSTKVQVSATGKILLQAPRQIHVKDSKITASVQIDAITSNLTSSSVDLGKRIAEELMTDAATRTDTTTVSKGLDDLQSALGKTNADAIGTQMKGLVNLVEAGGYGSIVAAVVAVIVIGMVASMMGRRGASDDASPATGDELGDEFGQEPLPLSYDAPPYGVDHMGPDSAVHSGGVSNVLTPMDDTSSLAYATPMAKTSAFDTMLRGLQQVQRSRRRQAFDLVSASASPRRIRRVRRTSAGGGRGQSKAIMNTIVKLVFVVYAFLAGRDLLRGLPNPLALLRGDVGAFFGSLNPFTAWGRLARPLIRLIIGLVVFKLYCLFFMRSPSVVLCMLS